MDQASLTVGRIGKTGEDVVLGEFRVIPDNFLVRHSCRKPPQHIFHRDPHAADARAAAAFPRLDGDDLTVIHRAMHPARI
jgi:hypothetical protein